MVDFRTSLRRRFVKFRQLQVQYQPEVAPLLSQLPATNMDPGAIHNTTLFLPSSLPRDVRSKSSKRLVAMETDLRIGQCRDSLSQLRTKLSAKARLLKYKYVNVRNQGPNTRSLGHIGRVNAKLAVAATKYRNAFAMLQILDQSSESQWRSEFLELRDQDIRSMSEPEFPNARTRERAEELQARSLLNGGGIPEGNRTVSWIWRGSVKDGLGDRSGQDELGEGLNVSIRTCGPFADGSRNQSFVSSGQKPMQDNPGGKKKSHFSRRRCDGSLPTWDGSLGTGFKRAAPPLSRRSPLVRTGPMASALMRLGKQRFSAISATTF